MQITNFTHNNASSIRHLTTNLSNTTTVRQTIFKSTRAYQMPNTLIHYVYVNNVQCNKAVDDKINIYPQGKNRIVYGEQTLG